MADAAVPAPGVAAAARNAAAAAIPIAPAWAAVVAAGEMLAGMLGRVVSPFSH